MVQALPMLAMAVLSAGATAAAGALTKPKTSGITPPPPVNRNIAADAARREDPLRQRRGEGANVLTGPGAAPSQTAGTQALLGG